MADVDVEVPAAEEVPVEEEEEEEVAVEEKVVEEAVPRWTRLWTKVTED
jgi:hypothetical protein